jgi:hemerythrin-like domain-containing protein
VNQLMLPGQAAAPDGPVDGTGMYLMHRAFRRDLDLFVAAAEATPAGDRNTWRRLARRWELFSSTLHKHHTGEDAGLWPLLRERGADPAVLDAMEAEHGRIDPLLERCAAAFTALSRGKDRRTTLIDDTKALRDALRAHLAHEEREAMALVQAHLAPEDWDRLDREVFAAEYGPRDIPKVLAWVMHGLPDDVVRRLPTMNAPMRLFGKLLAGPFARAERRTFAYVPRGNRPDTAAIATPARVVDRMQTAVLRRSGG